jgi:hypothetical protein
VPIDHGSAAHALQLTRLRQRPQIVADGALGYTKLPGKFRHTHAGLLAQDLDEALLTLKGRQEDFAFCAVDIVEICRFVAET